MTRTNPTTLAVAADYADAMLVARRAKNVLFWLIFACLVVQLAIFFITRYSSTVQIRPSDDSAGSPRIAAFLEYCIDVTNYAGVLLPIILATVLLVIVKIMLVGRLIGVSQVTSAFCWSIVLICLLFPLQALLNTNTIRASAAVYSTSTTKPGVNAQATPDVRIPGALYTWPELVRDYDFPRDLDTTQYNVGWTEFLKWVRYVAYPVAMLLILLVVHARSRRGLRFALGEAEVAEPVNPAG